jgi:hypothetical protein
MTPQTAATSSACPGCGAVLPAIEGPTNPQRPASAACSAAVGEITARCYQESELLSVRQLPIDAWAVQHPGPPGRITNQSLALHLMTLCLFIEDGVDPADGSALHAQMMTLRPSYAWLEPPRQPGWLTTADVLLAANLTDYPPSEYTQAVRDWAESAWRAWRPAHDTVRAWLRRWEDTTAKSARSNQAKRPLRRGR